MTRHPIGLNQRQETDDTRTITYLQSMGGVTAHLCHFDNGALSRLHHYKAHTDMLIWRPREDTQETLFRVHPDAAQYVRNCRAQLLGKGFKANEVWLHLHNEPEWSFSMLEWERQAAEAAVALGMRVVVCNPSVGTPRENMIYMAEKLLRLTAQHPDQIVIGLHEYFSVYGHRKQPWYLRRWSFWEDFRISKGIGPVRYLITEFGADNVADDSNYTEQFRAPFKTRNGVEKLIPKGVHQLDGAWSQTYNKSGHNPNPKPYPGKDEAYYEQVIAAYETGKYADAAIIGALIFCWGNEWPDFDISRMTVFQRKLADWWKQNKPTGPLPQPEPEPPPPPVIVPEPPDEPDTTEIKPVVAIDRATAEAQLAKCRQIAETLHREMQIVSSQITAQESQRKILDTQIQLNQVALQELDTSANQLQSIILMLEMALEGKQEEAADAA